ncbi:hypothetical protein BST83_08055 [Polaribacter filamentus]|jgi:hypothetical protein|uniref:Uncharacterized protein n=1 Tax=Polaribacter filamentus TaxID=53483 RepID=A0A2S7KWS6_9FLAO|nr:hypothetical protein [Polaribacter filamentus]PQB07105.1 hypothetical protein BST83_08055 [Polaribacter filamentus]
MVKYASGVNLWDKWAKIENAKIRKQTYTLPTIHNKYPGIVVYLSRFDNPDTFSFTDSEIVWKMDKK